MRKRGWKTLLRGMLTAVLLGCLGLRVFRMAASWPEVTRFYGIGSFGFRWSLISLLFFAAPFLVIGLAALALWLPGQRGIVPGWAGLWGGGFVCLEEGLTLFARAMNGNGGYVGAEPLLSLTVWAVAGIAVLLAGKTGT